MSDLEACVDGLLGRDGDRAPASALQRLEAALGAVVARARRTLGDLTVRAIAQRALVTNRARFPVLETVSVDPGGFRLDALLAGEPTGELVLAVRALTITLLSMLDLVSAKVLTPALTAAVASAGAEPKRSSPGRVSPEGVPMAPAVVLPRVETGIPNLDTILQGGLVRGTSIVLAGPPGSGKTILAQQICFHAATEEAKVIYFDTLSEPTAKKFMFLRSFDFFDQTKLDASIHFIDLGTYLPENALERSAAAMMREVERVRPAIVVIDSFKVFDNMATTREEFRTFVYDIVVKLMAWGCTSILLGEYATDTFADNPIFSVIDGVISLFQQDLAGERLRHMQVLKMRGTGHSPDAHPFQISTRGIDVFPSRVAIARNPRAPAEHGGESRLRTGIGKLDELITAGIVRGSAILIAGATGTGKSVLSLEFVYRGAKDFDEPGIIFAFEETSERIRFEARSLGFDLDREIERGMIKVIYIPQPKVLVDAHVLMIRDEIEKIGAKRVVLDSLSLFLTKIDEPQVVREKIYQVAALCHNAQAVGFFVADIPYGTDQVSRFGFEETLVDGLFLLSSREEGLTRQRYIDIYKLRNTPHMKGRHTMVIGSGGIAIYPRYVSPDPDAEPPPPPADTDRRLSTGVPGLDPLVGGGLLERSATLLYGSPGAGKTFLALQFLVEGVRRGEPGVYLTLEEGPEQLMKNAERLGLPLADAVERGLVHIEYLSQEGIRAIDFLAITSDKLQKLSARRFVLDSTSQVVGFGLASDEMRKLLYGLVVRFKTLDVTSVITIETRNLFPSEPLLDSDLPVIAENVIVLRYAEVEGQRYHNLTVIKTRGSYHDEATHGFVIEKGGIHLNGTPTADLRQGKIVSARPERKSKRKKSA